MKILGLCGTNPYPFSRLIKLLEKVAFCTAHKVTIQVGHSELPENCSGFRFRPRSEILDLIGEADVVVGQAGYGTCLDVLSVGRPLILVPRQKDLGECLDNQAELAQYLVHSGRAQSILTFDELVAALALVNASPQTNLSSSTPQVGSAVAHEISEFLNRAD